MGSDPFGGMEGYRDYLGIYNPEEIECIKRFINVLKIKKASIESDDEFWLGYESALNELIDTYEKSLEEDKKKRNDPKTYER